MARTYKNKLETVLKDFDASWEYCEGSWHQRWQDNFYLYNNQRVKRGYEGITDTFIPMVFGTVETLASALFGTKPKFEYLPPQERPDQKTDILNGLLDFYWDKDQWNIKVINWGRAMLVTGTSIVYLYWDRDCPRMINVPIRDFFIDPTATTLENARYMGRRYLTTIKELEEFEIVDPDTGEMKKKYMNLNKAQPGGSRGENTDKQEKDMWYGSTVKNPHEQQVEVIEYWTEDEVCSVMNRSVLIEESENYFKSKARSNGDKYPKGIQPFAALRNYTDESLFYAKSEVDFLFDQQELLNDITNQNIDSVTYTLNQMYALDPKFAHLTNEIENLPGAVYPITPDALAPIPQRPVPTEAFAERQNIKNEMRETAASNEIIRGVGVQGGDKTTATEINAQIAGAGQRVGLKVTQIENEGFHRLAKIVFEMIKLYVSEPMMVRILGTDGTRWEEFDPIEFQGDYEPRVQLDISIESQKQQDAAETKELLAAFLGDPDINQQELKKIALRKAFDLDPDEVETLVQPTQELPGEMGVPEAVPEATPGAVPEITEADLLGVAGGF